MNWATTLEDFAAQADDRSSAAFRQLVACLWDNGSLRADAPAATPALVQLLANPGTSEIKRARLALLLGLLAEGREEPATLARSAVQSGLPYYLRILGESTAPTVRLALIYLLAHFYEDRASILAHASVEGAASDPAIARLDRILRFQDPSSGEIVEYTKQFVRDETIPTEVAYAQVRASMLSPFGAEALFTIEHH
jgi:hypothetical protein